MNTKGDCLYKRYIGERDIEQLYTSIGRRIREEREAVGLSQDYLARLIGINRPSLTLMESGRQRVQVHSLYAIADVLGIPLADLLPLKPK